MTSTRRRIALAATLASLVGLSLPAFAEEQRPPHDPYWERERREAQRPQDGWGWTDRRWWQRDQRRDDRWRDQRRWDDDDDRRDGRRWREREDRRWSD